MKLTRGRISRTEQLEYRLTARLAFDETGVTAIEFAMLAPVLLLLMLGMFDLGHMAYGHAVLNGAVQHAARTSSLETGDTLAADAKVVEITKPILPGADYAFKRISYEDFDDVGRPEAWNDSDGNGLCDNDENFVDENGNGIWDEDIGIDGNGGAGDVVVYQVDVTYEPVFAVPLLAKTGDLRTISATTALKRNQPFAKQSGYGSEAGVCE